MREADFLDQLYTLLDADVVGLGTDEKLRLGRNGSPRGSEREG
jgi:hypothetical protein